MAGCFFISQLLWLHSKVSMDGKIASFGIKHISRCLLRQHNAKLSFFAASTAAAAFLPHFIVCSIVAHDPQNNRTSSLKVRFKNSNPLKMHETCSSNKCSRIKTECRADIKKETRTKKVEMN